eukprot:4253588-Pyramimonas_sp.AAC.1
MRPSWAAWVHLGPPWRQSWARPGRRWCRRGSGPSGRTGGRPPFWRPLRPSWMVLPREGFTSETK